MESGSSDERQYLRDVGRIAVALERAAAAMERAATEAERFNDAWYGDNPPRFVVVDGGGH